MRDGYFSQCKTCFNEQAKKRYEPRRQANIVRRKARVEAETKTCWKCGRTLPATEEFFPRRSDSVDGLRGTCRECKSEFDEQYRAENKDHLMELNRIWRANHPEECKANCKKYRDTHKEQRKISVKESRERHYDTFLEYQRGYRNNRRHNEPALRLSHSMSTAIGQALHERKSGRHWETLVGYTLEDLIHHLEPQFQPGMTLANYGGIDGWAVDHIVPQKAFDYSSPDDPGFKECWALSNLQPMWFRDNSIKGANHQGIDYRYVDKSAGGQS
jgi:hypothetical protein